MDTQKGDGDERNGSPIRWGYTYQCQCAILLTLNYFFEPRRHNSILFDLSNGFLKRVDTINLEGKDQVPDVDPEREGEKIDADLEDITFVSGDRQIIIQVKSKQAEGERWTPTDPLLLKALYRFYDSPLLAVQPDNLRLAFLTNRSFNPALAKTKSAISGDGVLAEQSHPLGKQVGRLE